jgi:NAD(P)-dependent dehydrogenase (short-subunit alcohol dehydrogenase family)
MEITLKDKVALVTGGGGGIGRAIVEAFADLGAAVVVAEIDPARADSVRKSLDAKRVPNLVLTADVRERADVARIMAEIEQRYGRLNVLVNNVGDSLRMVKPFADSAEDEWEALYQINLLHVFRVTHAAIPLLRRGGRGGSIISVSSIEALRGYPMGVVYTAMKTAMTGFTKSLACELGSEDIRVNAIAPETTETEQIQIVKSVKPEYQDHMKRWFPLGRYGRPEDSAGAAVYLATDLSRWVTGETILVDGGALAQGGWRQTRQGQWTNSPIIDAAHRAYGPVKP